MKPAQRVARRFRSAREGDRPSIWVNVWDDSPPSIPIEVDFETLTYETWYRADGSSYRHDLEPFPLDTVVRMSCLQWLKRATEAAGYTVHWSAPSIPTSDAFSGPQVKTAHIEKVFTVENPQWPGLSPVAAWNSDSHHAFIQALRALYTQLGIWHGVPLTVSCES